MSIDGGGILLAEKAVGYFLKEILSGHAMGLSRRVSYTSQDKSINEDFLSLNLFSDVGDG